MGLLRLKKPLKINKDYILGAGTIMSESSWLDIIGRKGGIDTDIESDDEWWEKELETTASDHIDNVRCWVSVKDKLPPNKTSMYLVCRKGHIEFDRWIYEKGNGRWYNYFKITHWMELPKLPCSQ